MKSNKGILYYITICLVIGLVFSINTKPVSAISHDFTNYNGIVITLDQYMTLLNLGFTEDEIYYMTEETFNENKDLSATLLSVTQKYYKTVYPTYGNSYTVEVTEEEYYGNNEEDHLLGFVETAYKTVLSSISANGSLYRFKVTESWKQMPSNKSYDVIAIGFNGHIHINNTITTYYSYTTSSGATTTSYSYFDKLYSSTGGSTTFKLPSSFIGMSTTSYFDVAKDNGAGTITGLSACGDYAHSTTTVTGAQAASHSINIGGIYFSSSVVNKFDEIPCAPASLSVSW